MSSEVAKVRQALANQHPLHGVYGRVFERLGGEEFLLEWAMQNPGRYLNQFVRMIPSVMPQQGVQGDVNITIHHELGPTALDSATLDEQGRVID